MPRGKSRSMNLIPMIFGTLAAIAFVWAVIGLAGAAPVYTFHRTRLVQLPDAAARKILKRVLARTPNLDADWLADEGFRPKGVYQADGLFGKPKIIAWEKRAEATWLCGYFLPDGQCQLDFVSKIDAGALTTGTSKDGHLFPPSLGNFVQTFDVETTHELYEHHLDALNFLYSASNRQADVTIPDFADYFAESIKEQGRFIRTILLWPARVPWWYFSRRISRHNRRVEQLYDAFAIRADV